MCLAEALLRTPDDATPRPADRREDRLGRLGGASGPVRQPVRQRLDLGPDADRPAGRRGRAGARRDLPGFLARLAGRVGEPVIRAAVATAVGIMGEQFVLGRTIEAGAAAGRARGLPLLVRHAGRRRAHRRRRRALRGRLRRRHRRHRRRHAGGQGPETGHGISVKLSALSPALRGDAGGARLGRALSAPACGWPRSRREHDINLTIDAEEADRLVLSLKLLDRLAREPALGDWRGLGLAVQAYQKRAPAGDRPAGRRWRGDSGRRLMVRLVKGAYWDSEIKRAQVARPAGLSGLHHQGRRPTSPIWSAPRPLIARGAAPLRASSPPTTPTPWPRCGAWPSGAASCRVPAPARHGRGAVRAPRASAGATAAARLCAGRRRMRTCCPIWCAACWRTAPTPPSSTPCSTSDVPAEDVVADPIAAVESRAAPASAHPDAAAHLRPDAAELAGRDLPAPSAAAWRGARSVDDELVEPARSSAAACRDAPSRCEPRRPRRVVGEVPTRRGRRSTRPSPRPARPSRPGTRAGGAARAKVLRAMADALERDMRPPDRACCAREAGKTLADARRRGARGGRLLPLLRASGRDASSPAPRR